MRFLVCHDTLACMLSEPQETLRCKATTGDYRCALGEAETLRCLAIDSDYRCAAAF